LIFFSLLTQILLDVVDLFNMVSSLSKKKQSIKITHEGIEVIVFFTCITKFIIWCIVQLVIVIFWEMLTCALRA